MPKIPEQETNPILKCPKHKTIMKTVFIIQEKTAISLTNVFYCQKCERIYYQEITT